MINQLLHLQADIPFAFRENRIAVTAVAVWSIAHIAGARNFVDGEYRPPLLISVRRAVPASMQRHHLGFVEYARVLTQHLVIGNHRGLPRTVWGLSGGPPGQLALWRGYPGGGAALRRLFLVRIRRHAMPPRSLPAQSEQRLRRRPGRPPRPGLPVRAAAAAPPVAGPVNAPA